MICLSHMAPHMMFFDITSLTKGYSNSGFPSIRINLSPFTKDFRGGEHLNESID